MAAVAVARGRRPLLWALGRLTGVGIVVRQSGRAGGRSVVLGARLVY